MLLMMVSSTFCEYGRYHSSCNIEPLHVDGADSSVPLFFQYLHKSFIVEVGLILHFWIKTHYVYFFTGVLCVFFQSADQKPDCVWVFGTEWMYIHSVAYFCVRNFHQGQWGTLVPLMYACMSERDGLRWHNTHVTFINSF